VFERVTSDSGCIVITDLRRTWLGLFVKELRKSMTLEEALSVIHSSRLRPGISKKGSFWWDYLAGSGFGEPVG